MHTRALVPLALLVLLLGACGGGDPAAPRSAAGEPVVEDPGAVHIHGLGRDPGDGSLLIATHTGLFRAADGGRPERIGDDFQDTMGFTVVGPDRFLGSGHPGSVRDDPPYLGLIESRDGGRSWRSLSLRGEVDFHVLEANGRTIYGFGSDFESREPRFLRSDDGGRRWTALTPPEPLISLAIDPQEPRTIVASGEQRSYVSRRGGDGWRQLAAAPGLLAWTAETGLTSAGLDGVVRGAGDPDGRWTDVGSLPGPPAAFESHGDELLAALHDGRVLSSTDRGASWEQLVEAAP